MAIRIVRNENGNCITFIGSSQPAYWNACLSGQVNAEEPTRVDVVNDVRTTDTNNPVYEFYAVDFTTFQDQEGNSFETAQDCADYITEKANVLSDAIVLSANDNVNFTRDPTNTSILTSLGDNFGVNAIKAVEAADGTITIREFQDDSGQDLYTGLRPNRTKIEGQEQNLTITAVVNSLNAHFSVNPVGLGIEDAVVSFVYTQQTPGITAFGNTTDSAGIITKGVNTGSQRNDGFHTDSTGDTLIKDRGDYFQVNTTGYNFGRNFLFGLFNRDGIAGGDSVFALNNDAGGKLDLGLRLAPNAAFEDGPHGVVIEEGFFKDPQNSTQFRVGMNADRRLFISHFSTETNEYQDVVRSAFPVDSGEEFMLAAYLFDSGSQFNAGVIRNKLADSTTVAFRYIESPDGVFRYPLFATELEAGTVSIANGGADSSDAHLFVDDPSGSTWYAPGTGYVANSTSAPRDSGDIVYTEISSGVDAQFAPSAFTFPNYTFAENAAVNIQTFPAGASFNQTLSGDLPAGISYDNATGFITGTTPYVSKSKSWSATLTRSNAYGSTSASFAINITNNASLDDISGITKYIGNTFQPDIIEEKDVMDSDYGFFADVNQKLVRGQQMDWVAVVGDTNAPTDNVWQTPILGVLTDAAADSADKAANTDTYTWKANASWKLKAPIFPNDVGGLSIELLRGFTDNNRIQGSGYVNQDKTFRLAISDSDGLMRLYRSNGSSYDLLKTSTDTYDSARFSLWMPSDYGSRRRKVQSFTFSTIGANDSTPPAGFKSPLENGLMSTEMIMGSADSTTSGNTALMLNKLEPGKRLVIPKTWIEDNILDLMKDSGMGFTGNEGGKVFIGVPKKNANFNVANLNDYTAVNRWEYKENGQFKLTKDANYWTPTPDAVDGRVSVGVDQITVNTSNYDNAYYDAAVEWDGEHFYVIQCNIGDINQQPGVENGGSFSRVSGTDDSARATVGVSDYGSDSDVDVAFTCSDKGRLRLQRQGIQLIDIPLTSNDFVAHKDSAGAELTFNDSAIARSGLTLNAGYTYRFYENQLTDSARISFTAGGSEYTTGVTRKGSYPEYLNYTQIAVDSAVPPLKMVYNGDSGVNVSISGSSYVAPSEGITLEGPAANQTGTNVMDQYDYGWISIDEQISAGERLVLDNAFFADFLAEFVDNNNIFAIGLKGDNWTNTKQINSFGAGSSGEFFKGDTYLVGVCNSNGTAVQLRIVANGTAGNTMLLNTTSLYADTCAFIDVTSTGNNIRMGFGRNGDFSVTQGDESTETYADWPSYKGQTGDQGYGITSKDLVMSFWTWDGGSIDGAEIDWTGLSVINVPVAFASTVTTNYAKALDFSGGSEYAKQTSNDNYHQPLRMGARTNTVAEHTTQGSSYTSNSIDARPWAVTCVFNADGSSSNQHIWNQGEGSGSTDDNIYLRLDASRNLYFGWGRTGSLNECIIASAITAGSWYGVYIASTGERLSGNNATAANLADCFDIRIMTEDDWTAVGSNLCTSTNWSNGTTGGRMDRQFQGDFTIGGRYANRNFHGKIASCVVTTLLRSTAMPTDAEIRMMTYDPQQWLTNYKVGEFYRQPYANGATSNFSLNNTFAARGTQVWLMGDGTSDAFSKIRNQVYAASQNETTLDMNSMVSNDIESVTIPDLTD